MVSEKELQEFLERYEKYEVTRSNKTIYLEGEVDVKDKEGGLYDRFHIGILFNKNYPDSFPKVFELDGKIPRKDSRHINIHVDNSCCLSIPIKEKLFVERGYELLEFYEEIVVPFFANQVFYNKVGDWADGDYRHGVNGVLQFYEELFGTRNRPKVIYGLKLVLATYKPPLDFTKCFCGSKKQYQVCHKVTIETLKTVFIKYVKEDIKTFVKG